jgi:hypothetical protein
MKTKTKRYLSLEQLAELREYIKSLTAEEFAHWVSVAGTSPANMGHIANGFRCASPALARRMVAASGGKLRREAIRPDLWG